jgi:hypothetical protein
LRWEWTYFGVEEVRGAVVSMGRECGRCFDAVTAVRRLKDHRAVQQVEEHENMMPKFKLFGRSESALSNRSV